jgi:hypothetical protein
LTKKEWFVNHFSHETSKGNVNIKQAVFANSLIIYEINGGLFNELIFLFIKK